MNIEITSACLDYNHGNNAVLRYPLFNSNYNLQSACTNQQDVREAYARRTRGVRVVFSEKECDLVVVLV